MWRLQDGVTVVDECCCCAGVCWNFCGPGSESVVEVAAATTGITTDTAVWIFTGCAVGQLSVLPLVPYPSMPMLLSKEVDESGCRCHFCSSALSNVGAVVVVVVVANANAAAMWTATNTALLTVTGCAVGCLSVLPLLLCPLLPNRMSKETDEFESVGVGRA